MSDLRKAAEIALETLRLFAVQEDEKGMAAIKTLIVIKEALQQEDWVGLTDKELSTLSVSAGIISWSKHDYLADKKQFRELPIDEGMDGDKVCLMQFAQLIEAKLKEKNA